MTVDSEVNSSSDQELAKIIESQSAGVETAMRVFEKAEKIYYGAVAATAVQEGVTVSTSTSPRNHRSETC